MTKKIKLKKISTLTIDVKRWVRGRYAQSRGSSALLTDKDCMCCLGGARVILLKYGSEWM